MAQASIRLSRQSYHLEKSPAMKETLSILTAHGGCPTEILPLLIFVAMLPYSSNATPDPRPNAVCFEDRTECRFRRLVVLALTMGAPTKGDEKISNTLTEDAKNGRVKQWSEFSISAYPDAWNEYKSLCVAINGAMRRWISQAEVVRHCPFLRAKHYRRVGYADAVETGKVRVRVSGSLHKDSATSGGGESPVMRPAVVTAHIREET
ncbi:hypothetical protein K402DRAFT_455580 [Aulographum hederae CBS 113979]|uniref:Uncharacterized protein n=1 Tax=Aulographum hederae CBS 113979 TaxID=1176131 RepID=A0A6G1GV90_9PEZI|nr:hypothetical protein K402DRAFT_455580 [Aulographum hederae CBS 113979]